jgi:Leu/Phe-tRNA-protein transferase
MLKKIDGYIIIEPGNDPNEIMDTIIETEYGMEYCVSYSFDPEFTAGLMSAGFLIMAIGKSTLVPMHHLTRAVLHFDNLHIGKTARRHIHKYELRFNDDLETIINKCSAVHGNGWLTQPLVETIIKIKQGNFQNARPVAFGVYRNGELKAGEFGIISGRVYTSYSGYHEENNAGNAQIILTAQYLREHGFSFWDLGQPLKYKTELGAKNINLSQFLTIFREANSSSA